MARARKQLWCLPCHVNGRWGPGPSSLGTCTKCGRTGVLRREPMPRSDLGRTVPHRTPRHDESTALRDDNPRVPVDVLERLYRAAFIIDERGEGNEMVDEILNTLTPYVSEEARDRIETEVHTDPESGCEGG